MQRVFDGYGFTICQRGTQSSLFWCQIETVVERYFNFVFSLILKLLDYKIYMCMQYKNSNLCCWIMRQN